jgi:hypothetical protein
MGLRRVDTGDAVLMVVLQQIGANVAPRNLGVVKGQLRIDHVTANHAGGLCKVVLVVAVRTAKRDDRSDRCTATTCATRALLVIGAAGRHVTQGHARQHADIDADFHGRRARQDVDCGRAASLSPESRRYVLKQEFVLLRL